MALRGLDLDDPYQLTRKEAFHYLDGESNLNMLVNSLSKMSGGENVLPAETKMITFDNLKVEL